MEWLSSFASMNVFTMIVVLAVIAVVIIVLKKGWFSFSEGKLNIGQDLKTRVLIQSQMEYANAKCEGLFAIYRDRVEEYKLKYIIARIEDIFEKSIVFNNLTDDEFYVKAKQELVYQCILKRSTCDWVLQDAFKADIYKFVADVFKELYRMKRTQS